MKFSEDIKDIISELINTGIGRAAVSLNELLNYEIKLKLPVLKILNSVELSEYIVLKSDGQQYVSVCQSFSGDLTGKGIVSFPIIDGKTLVNILLEQDESEPGFDVVELEAIGEVGNIVINAVQSTISDMAGVEVSCNLPIVKILKQIMPPISKTNENIYLIGETFFDVEKIKINGIIILIYSIHNIPCFIKNFL